MSGRKRQQGEDGAGGWTERLARTRWAFPAALVALSLAIYARSVPYGLVNFDDDEYLFEDPRLGRLTPSNVGRILARPYFANYHPVTTLTYAFDRAVWGKWVPGSRLTQLAFYSLGVVLVYYLFRMILGTEWAAFAGAAVYASHAIHVEAVAWLAQRKDVVCLVFYTASIIAYARYSREDERPGRLYAASLALGVLAMLSKGYAVVLPAVLLAYDLCFAQRIRRRELLDKLPFLAASVAVTVFTILSQEAVKALVESSYGTWDRFLMLCKVFAVYAGRTVLPVRLSALYVVGRSWIDWWALPGFVLGAGAVAGFVMLRKRRPAIAFGIALYVLPLATVMNALFSEKVLRVWLADRYLFLPTMGSSLALAGAGLALFRRRPAPETLTRALGSVASATVVLYSALTVARIGAWRDAVSLWSDAVRKHSGLSGSGPVTFDEIDRERPARLSRRLVTPLAMAHGRAGNHEEAVRLLSRIKFPGPSRPGGKGEVETGAELALAKIAIDEKRYDEAITLAMKVARGGTWIAPRGWGTAGRAHAKKGDFDAARKAFEKSIELYRASGRSAAGAMQDLGLVELMAGNPAKAAGWYRRAREAAPDDPRALHGLAVASERLGRRDEAVAYYRDMLRLAPGHPGRSAIEAAIRRLSQGGPVEGGEGGEGEGSPSPARP